MLLLFLAIAVISLAGSFVCALHTVDGNQQDPSIASTLFAVFLLAGILGVIGMIVIGLNQAT